MIFMTMSLIFDDGFDDVDDSDDDCMIMTICDGVDDDGIMMMMRMMS